MSAQGIHLDPEVEGLLREIAADPGSSLLRVERPKTLRPLLEREHAAGARMAGLTNAERHLLERYRDEVGYALLWGAFLLLREDEAVREHMALFDSQGRPSRMLDGERWRRKVEELRYRSMGPTPEARPEGLDLLIAASCDLGGAGSGVVELCLASMRVRPTPHANVYCAEHWASHEQLDTARLAIHSLLRRGADSHWTAWAWTNMGFLAHREGDHATARTAYARAAALSPRNPTSAGCALVQSMLLGDANGAVRFAVQLDQVIQGHSEIVCMPASLIRSEISKGRLSRLDTKGLLGGRYEQLGDESRRVVDAISLS